jgi:long-chain acyl-CoA synthetase
VRRRPGCSCDASAAARVSRFCRPAGEFLAAFFGIIRAGLVAVPVNRKLPAATVEFILRDCGVRLVLLRPGAPAALPRRFAALLLRGGFRGTARPGPVCRGYATPGDVSLHLGLQRPAQGCGAVASQPSLGHRYAAPYRRGRRKLSASRGATLPMNALAVAQAALAQHDTIILLASTYRGRR